MTPINDTPTANNGSAKNPVNNPSALMWALLLGLPGALFTILLFKLNS